MDELDKSRIANADIPETDIEITPEMIEAVDGLSVESSDYTEERIRAYSEIFARMLLASEAPNLLKFKSVVGAGVVWDRQQGIDAVQV